MDYLTNKMDIEHGAILKIYQDKKFEGWAMLLELSGEPISFIDKAAVYVKERWLVEFVPVEDVPVEMSTKERWDQRSLAGLRTHRYVTYFGSTRWELYVQRNGNPKDTIERSNDYLKIDDENDIF